jgi:hypothetical protein
MSKNTLEDYDSGFSPMSAADFAVLIADHPALGPMVAEIEIPTRTINPVRHEMMGKSRVVPGRRISSSNTVNITFTLNRKDNTYQELIILQESFSESKTGNIVGKRFDMRVINYDEAGFEAIVMTFRNCWLSEVGSFQNSGTSEAQLISVPCILAYDSISYHFTGIGNLAERVISIISRITGTPINATNSNALGGFTPLGVSRSLPGSEPFDVIVKARQRISDFAGLSFDDISSMRDVVMSVRNTLSSFNTKFSELKSAAKSGDVGSLLSGLKLSRF